MTIKSISLLSIYLCAGLCCPRETVDEETYIEQTPIKHTVVPTAQSISSTDTLWISGKVSKMVYRPLKHDSIERPNAPTSVISAFRFKTPNQVTNTAGALSSMEIIPIQGNAAPDFSNTNCATSIAITMVKDGNFYRYKLGLKPKEAGDYTLKLFGTDSFTNTDLHRNIAAKYPLSSGQIGYDFCGSNGWNAPQYKTDYSFTRE